MGILLPNGQPAPRVVSANSVTALVQSTVEQMLSELVQEIVNKMQERDLALCAKFSEEITKAVESMRGALQERDDQITVLTGKVQILENRLAQVKATPPPLDEFGMMAQKVLE